MRKTEYHIHVNGHEVDPTIANALFRRMHGALVKAGIDPSRIYHDPFNGRGRYHAPKVHYTLKTDRCITPVWNELVDYLNGLSSEQFRGYVELEALLEENRAEFPFKEVDFSPEGFPLTYLEYDQLWSVPAGERKIADVHVELPFGRRSSEDIAALLERAGFFTIEWPIANPTELVCTVQVKDLRDGKNIFHKLRNFFHERGGIQAIEYEITSRLVRYPPDFPMWPLRITHYDSM